MLTKSFKRGFAKINRMGGKSVVIVGAKRTPIGCFMGQLVNINAPVLGSSVARAAIEHAGIQPTDI